MSDVYLQRIVDARARLGITDDLLAGRELAVQLEATELEVVHRDPDGREYRLTPEAAQAWFALQRAAAEEGVVLHMVSAFRSFDYQIELIERQLRLDRPIADILRGSACPGYSEHHTGRAVDIDTPDNPGLGEDFERTAAFAWLGRHAGSFGFTLSFPRGNAAGYMYEPWHWLFNPVRGTA